MWLQFLGEVLANNVSVIIVSLYYSSDILLSFVEIKNRSIDILGGVDLLLIEVQLLLVVVLRESPHASSGDH